MVCDMVSHMTISCLCHAQVQRIADFEQQYETLLKHLPANVQEVVKSRQKDAASVAGIPVLIHYTYAQFLSCWSIPPR